MMGIIIAGFSATFYLVPNVAFPPRPALLLHAAVTFGWYALICVQSILIRQGNFDLHRTLGWASIALAVSIVVTGYFTTASAVVRPDWSINGRDPLASAVFPFFDLLTFSLFYVLAVTKRKDRVAHKRLMIMAGVMMIDPAAGRLGGLVFGIPAIIVAIELGLLAAILAYDLITLRKLHWTSLLGVSVFIGCMFARFALAETEGWKTFASALFL